MASTISTATPIRAKTEVVIIGGGSGATLARKLSAAALDFDPEQHNLTLIHSLPYSIFYPATARLIVTAEGALEDTALIPLDHLYEEGNAGKVVQGKVDRVLDGSVELVGGTSVKYDCLVVATGTLWEGPLAFPDTDQGVRAHIKSWREKFAASKSLVIIGGGAVGIELACEVKTFYPNTSVTIVHAQKELLNDVYPAKFRNATTARVKSFGITLILDDRLELPKDGATSATTTKGVQVTGDLFIPARGGRPNTDIIKAFDPSVITPSGHVKVLPSLQVPLASGKLNMFAMGDIIDWDEQHMAAKAGAHADTLTNNVLGAINNGVTPSIPYPGFMEAIFITMGPKAGSGYVPKLWGLVFGDWVVSYVKSSGLFVSQARKALGY